MTSVSQELYIAIEAIHSVQSLPDRVDLVRKLHRIADCVKRMEESFDSMVWEAMQDARPNCDALVRLVG